MGVREDVGELTVDTAGPTDEGGAGLGRGGFGVTVLTAEAPFTEAVAFSGTMAGFLLTALFVLTLAAVAFFALADLFALADFLAGAAFLAAVDFLAAVCFFAPTSLFTLASFVAGTARLAAAAFFEGVAFFPPVGASAPPDCLPPGAFSAAFDFTAAFSPRATASSGAFFAAFAVFRPPPGSCSPTAESRRTTTRPAPLACALTGDLDTRPA